MDTLPPCPSHDRPPCCSLEPHPLPLSAFLEWPSFPPPTPRAAPRQVSRRPGAARRALARAALRHAVLPGAGTGPAPRAAATAAGAGLAANKLWLRRWWEPPRAVHAGVGNTRTRVGHTHSRACGGWVRSELAFRLGRFSERAHDGRGRRQGDAQVAPELSFLSPDSPAAHVRPCPGAAWPREQHTHASAQARPFSTGRGTRRAHLVRGEGRDVSS
jgi:hypothetical protein